MFFAVFVPADLRPLLEQAQTKLVGRWWKKVHPDQFHVTLLFLGGVPKDALEALRKAGTKTARETASFTAQLRGTGFFPNEGSPRVWFVKTEAEGWATLAENLRAHLSEHADAEAFKPHITLARKKGSSPRPPPITIGQDFTVDRFALVRSTLTREGPAYQILEEFKLSPPPPSPGGT